MHCGGALAEAASRMDAEELLDAMALFGGADRCSDRFFIAPKRELLEGRSLLTTGDVSPWGAAIVADAFSAHLRRTTTTCSWFWPLV